MKNLTDKKPTLLLKKGIHRDRICLFLVFKYNDVILNKIRNLKMFRWSKSKKVWYGDFNEDTISIVKRALENEAQFIYDDSLEKKIIIPSNKKKRNISESNKEIIRDYIRFLKGKRYSKSTVRSYFTLIADFIAYIQPIPIDDLTHRNVELFIEDVFIKRNYSISTQRQLISAIKQFVLYYPNCKIDGVKLIRPKSSSFLPTVLSKQEIISILRYTKNLKHRAVIAMIYSAGLRISELINLELSHIDIERRQIIVKNAKGRKDRNVILAKSMIPLIKNYLNTYTPKFYFAEGQKGLKYSAESIRSFLKRSCENAQISKKVTPHTLRHSYATHLLESGIDLRYIQELLGHVKPETTMIYTHVSKKDLLNIESPLYIIVKSYMKDDIKRENLKISDKY